MRNVDFFALFHDQGTEKYCFNSSAGMRDGHFGLEQGEDLSSSLGTLWVHMESC